MKRRPIPVIFLVIVLLILMAALALPRTSSAQELYLLGGGMQDSTTHSTSYTWSVSYLEGLGEHFAWSYSYLNEGHVPEHHRDGFAGQLWSRVNFFKRKLSLAAGAGPYAYFDTEPFGKSYEDAHGWGGIFSLSASYYLDDRWILHVRANHVQTGGDINTDGILFGIGYQLQASETQGPRDWPAEPTRGGYRNNELAVLFGRTITNSFNSERSFATAIEYRRNILPWLDGTVGWMYEGNNDLLRRNGITVQVWPTRTFFENRLALAAGFGAYLAVDRYRDTSPQEGGNATIAGLVSLTASYNLGEQYLIRASFYRTLTNYNRDTDVFVIGPGFRF